MRFLLGMSLREIAIAMQWSPEGAVRSLVRGLATLRKRLTREGHVPVVIAPDIQRSPAPPGGWAAWLRRIGRGEDASGDRWWRALYGGELPG